MLLSSRAVAARWGAMSSPSLVSSWHSGFYNSNVIVLIHTSFILCLQGHATCKMSAAFSIDRVSIFPASHFFHQFLLFLCVSMWLAV